MVGRNSVSGTKTSRLANINVITAYMNIESGVYKFSVNSDWITESGLKPFSKSTNHYFYELIKNQPVILVEHSDIDPSIRGENIPIFKDGEVDGKFLSAKQRVLNILNAIVQDTPLPPVEVKELIKNQYKYKLYHGCHRLHLSILAGFKFIPAIIVNWL